MFMRFDRMSKIKMTDTNQRTCVKLLWTTSYIFAMFVHVIKYGKTPLVPAKKGAKLSLILV